MTAVVDGVTSDEAAEAAPAARFLLERRSVMDAGAVYRVMVTGDGEMWRGEATITPLEGRVALEWEAGAPAPWMNETALAFLRTVMSGWKRDQAADPDEATWPRRIHRWRAKRR